jgi:citronellol/citronellal dehydrogenase
MPDLKGSTLFITGASRGIGLAIALRAARDGANVVVAAKTDTPHPKLPGTVHTACDEIRAAGGQALACVLDVRDEAQVAAGLETARKHFGGVDILVNNASAISLTPAQATPMARFDLMHQVNARATFLCSKLAYDLLRNGKNPHILTLSPPLNIAPHWFSPHVAYSLSKFGMSLCTLGLAGEYASAGIAVNSLWPKTMIATAAVSHLLGKDGLRHCRKPEIVADAAYSILTEPARSFTGRFCIDEDVLREAGVTDFDVYAVEPGATPAPDIFL